MIDLSNSHPLQISNSLKWLRNLRAQIDAEIQALETRAEENKAATERKNAFNALARDLISKNITDIEAENRLVEMGWSNEDIQGSQKRLKLLADRRRREFRDAEIVRQMCLKRASASEIAKEFKISRKHVYEILKKKNPFSRF